MILEFHFHIPVDIVRVKSYSNCLFDPVSVPVRIITHFGIRLSLLIVDPHWHTSQVTTL